MCSTKVQQKGVSTDAYDGEQYTLQEHEWILKNATVVVCKNFLVF